ncbi:MAG: tRNA uridine-5-carboxymethylaminomethyl(34) synthesis GTPase MnmE [Clostridia bacterium]
MKEGKMKTETIAAVSTPPGTGGISCIRISGEDAFAITSAIFFCRGSFDEKKSHTVTYGRIMNEADEILDEVLVLKMKAPKTYTREDIVEIHCHGGTTAVRSILDLLYRKGAAPAQPGEFTKRAFLNGRMDLSQAEAVMDIINSKTRKSEKSAALQLEGRTGKKVREIREELVGLLSQIGVAMDYPEYEDGDISLNAAVSTVFAIRKKLLKLIENFETGQILREGLNVAVIGPPNAGKSTFINKVTGEEKAIVTHIPGTTRDVLEVQFSLRGFPIILHDTAGIRETDDFIEKLGIEKTLIAKEKSEIIILVADAARGLDAETRGIIDATDRKNTIYAINKTDEEAGTGIREYIGEARIIECCFIRGEGTEEILDAIYSNIEGGELGIGEIAVTNSRHKLHIDKALESIENSLETAEKSGFLDLVAVDLTQAADELGKITGESAGEDIIGMIFSRFCVGK